MDEIKKRSTEKQSGQVTDSSWHLCDKQNFIELPRVLADTVSSYLELFELPDCARVGYNQNYNGNIGAANPITANGNVVRPRFLVEIQLLIDGVPWGPMMRTIACRRPWEPSPLFWDVCSPKYCKDVYSMQLPFHALVQRESQSPQIPS